MEITTRPKALHSLGIESMLNEETIVQWAGVFVEVIETVQRFYLMLI